MKRIFTTLLSVVSLTSCERFTELDAPKTQIVNSKVFENDAGTRSALAGLYSQIMIDPSFASGGSYGVTVIAGLSADELENHSISPGQAAIYENNLTPINTVSSAWTEAYRLIYSANSVIEGVEASAGVTPPVREQAIGEALFMRAFGYFYLINFYGDVPLLTTTDYRVNRVATRTPVGDVYRQIEEDLIKAQELLPDDYSLSNGEKVEPNKWVATALLARSYLYQNKWADAEAQSTSIIGSSLFSLSPDLNSVFLANSDEAIWQLMPVLTNVNTFDGLFFYGENEIAEVSVSSSVLNSFEANDNRAASWIAAYSPDDPSFAYPYKYKIVSGGQPLTEYQMVFRLAEQYLIRAEARAMQNNLHQAIDDVNVVRVRAGLDPIDANGLSQQQVMDAVEQERRAELFIEWGHRWFDLKRWGKIDSELGPVKPNWQSTDALFPIPQSEITADPNLTQNP